MYSSHASQERKPLKLEHRRIRSLPPSFPKLKPPFRNLPAFNVAALILSFHGYDYEVRDLLCKLCRNSKLYSQRDSSILEAFIAPLAPKIENVLSFGPRSKNWSFIYPEIDQLPVLARRARKRRIKLRAIKLRDRSDLTKGFQLLFTNDFETPMFDAGSSEG